MELAKKAASDPAPAPQVHVSKAAKKNAKRKEKKKQEQAGGGAPQTSHSQVTKAMEQVSISRPADSAGGKDNSEAKPDLAKKLKNLKKKLKQIEDLENKIKSGELKNPEKDQLEKVSKKQAVMDEIEDIELELEESWLFVIIFVRAALSTPTLWLNISLSTPTLWLNISLSTPTL